ncbi:MAG TPA: hypothetical protein VM537_19120 [Anaerolineae bacterium]|nr:hypothetical protein [Anaerolineae bacterium]
MSLLLVVYAVDVGSIKKKGGNFAWARAECVSGHVDVSTDTDIDRLVAEVVEDLGAGHSVALGFECPLFIPVRSDPTEFAARRLGEWNRPWSAGAGAARMATGLAQSVYVLRRVRESAEEAGLSVTPTLAPSQFTAGEANLLLWEAFVSGKSKTRSHVGDAESAARLCLCRLQADTPQTDIGGDGDVLSLVGAAAIRSGLSDATELLSQPCLVVRLSTEASTPR